MFEAWPASTRLILVSISRWRSGHRMLARVVDGEQRRFGCLPCQRVQDRRRSLEGALGLGDRGDAIELPSQFPLSVGSAGNEAGLLRRLKRALNGAGRRAQDAG